MKNFGKALKLYLKMTLNPIVSGFGLLIMLVILIVAALLPDSPDSEDYMSIIASVGFGQIGIAAFCLFGSIAISRNKFFTSLPFAKMLFTAVPAVVSATMSLIYFVVVITIAVLCWEPAGLSDILVFVPINSVMICLAVSAIGKPKLEWIYLICVMMLSVQQIALPNIGFTAHGLGLPVIAAAVTGALIFIAGIALTLLITNLWWKSANRVYRPANGGVQVNVT